VVRVPQGPGPQHPGGPREAGVQEPPGRREPGHQLTGPRLPVGDHRPLRDEELAHLLVEAACQRGPDRERLEHGVRLVVHRRWREREQAAGRVVRVRSGGGGVLRHRPEADRLACGHAALQLLPPGRVRGCPEGHVAPEGGARAHRLHAGALLPGRRAAPDVRLPGADRDPAPIRVPEVRAGRREPTDASREQRDQWIEQWTNTVLR